jgi:hypothetical protein
MMEGGNRGQNLRARKVEASDGNSGMRKKVLTRAEDEAVVKGGDGHRYKSTERDRAGELKRKEKRYGSGI